MSGEGRPAPAAVGFSHGRRFGCIAGLGRSEARTTQRWSPTAAGRRGNAGRQWFCRSASATGVLATRLAGKMAAATVASMPTAKAITSTEGTTRIIAV